MGFKVQTFDFKIGDAGVTQSDDGTGGTWVSVSSSAAADSCETIVNIADNQSLIGTITPGAPGTGLGLTPDGPGANTWSIYASYDVTATAYPIATGTTVFSVTAIIAY